VKHALDFAAHLVPLIEGGYKCSAIRPLRERNPEPGDELALHVEYHGFPWRPGRLLGATVVEDTADIVILPGARSPQVMLGHERLDEIQTEQLARGEGFQNAAAMTAWFAKRYALPFSGRVIVWRALAPTCHRRH